MKEYKEKRKVYCVTVIEIKSCVDYIACDSKEYAESVARKRYKEGHYKDIMRLDNTLFSTNDTTFIAEKLKTSEDDDKCPLLFSKEEMEEIAKTNAEIIKQLGLDE